MRAASSICSTWELPGPSPTARSSGERRTVWEGGEHFILMEILAHRAYRELDYDVNFWRTKSGLEVDFILGQGEVASR